MSHQTLYHRRSLTYIVLMLSSYHSDISKEFIGYVWIHTAHEFSTPVVAASRQQSSLDLEASTLDHWRHVGFPHVTQQCTTVPSRTSDGTSITWCFFDFICCISESPTSKLLLPLTPHAWGRCFLPQMWWGHPYDSNQQVWHSRECPS